MAAKGKNTMKGIVLHCCQGCSCGARVFLRVNRRQGPMCKSPDWSTAVSPVHHWIMITWIAFTRCPRASRQLSLDRVSSCCSTRPRHLDIARYRKRKRVDRRFLTHRQVQPIGWHSCCPKHGVERGAWGWRQGFRRMRYLFRFRSFTEKELTCLRVDLPMLKAGWPMAVSV
jgi:hypothetical protein